MKAGKEYSEGDVYSINHLRYKCQGGIMDVTGCYIEENRDLSIGQDIVEKGMVYRCYRLGPKVKGLLQYFYFFVMLIIMSRLNIQNMRAASEVPQVVLLRQFLKHPIRCQP